MAEAAPGDREETEWKHEARLLHIDEIVAAASSKDGLVKAIQGVESAMIWEPELTHRDPPIEPGIKEHIRSLGLIRVSRSIPGPPIVLHRLGSFGDDPALRNRVDNLFSGRNTFLVNTSGSGKTRLLYEGLCRNWGLFFTSVVDSTQLGLNDIHPIFEIKLPAEQEFTSVCYIRQSSVEPEHETLAPIPGLSEVEFASRVKRNVQLAHKHFGLVLLSRLLDFKTFLAMATSNGGIDDSLKKTWLKLQICYPYQDVELPSERILPASKTLSDKVIEDGISETLEEIFAIHDMGRVYIVLDEANVASNALLHAFRTEDGKSYPIILVMLRTWMSHLKRYPFTFVIAGTEIPAEHFTGEEWADYLWSSDTGSFDDKEIHRQYLSSFLPSALLSSEEGQRMLDRSWKWLRGRHRATASFVSLLLQRKFVEPNRQLDSYVYAISGGYWPHDSILGMGYMLATPFLKLNFKILNNAQQSEVASWTHETLTCDLLRPKECIEFTKEAINLVSSGLGRFLDTNCTQIAVDEPLVVAGAAHHFGLEPRSLIGFTHFQEKILLAPIAPRHAAAYITLCIAVTCDAEQSGANLFHLPKSGSSWADADVDIVFRQMKGRRKEEVLLKYSQDLSLELVTWSFEPDATVTWLKSHHTPFCIQLYGEEATLIFALRTSDEQYFWVFLRMLRPTTEDEDLVRAAKRTADSLHPKQALCYIDSNINAMVSKALQSLPGTSPASIGETRVLRVIGSFSQHIPISSLRSDKSSRIAILNTATLRTATDSYKSEALITRLVSNVVNNDSPTKRRHAPSSSRASHEDRAGKRAKNTPPSTSNAKGKSMTRTRSTKGAATSTPRTSTSRAGSSSTSNPQGLRRSRRLAR